MMRKLKQTPVIVKAVILKTKWTPFEDKLAAVPEATQSQPGRSGQDKVGMMVEPLVQVNKAKPEAGRGGGGGGVAQSVCEVLF